MNKKLEKFLEKNKIKCELICHRKVFTALDKAITLRVKPKTVGKTLVLKLGSPAGGFALVLIPANKNLDKGKFKEFINKQRKKEGLAAVKNVDFTTEPWIKKNLKGIKIGAIPPFGNLWKMRTFFDKGLLREKSILVSAGDHNHSLKISPKIFQKILGCNFGYFSKPR